MLMLSHNQMPSHNQVWSTLIVGSRFVVLLPIVAFRMCGSLICRGTCATLLNLVTLVIIGSQFRIWNLQ